MGLLWKLYSVKNKPMTDLVYDYAAKDRPREKHKKHKKNDTKQYSGVAMNTKHSK